MNSYVAFAAQTSCRLRLGLPGLRGLAGLRGVAGLALCLLFFASCALKPVDMPDAGDDLQAADAVNTTPDTGTAELAPTEVADNAEVLSADDAIVSPPDPCSDGCKPWQSCGADGCIIKVCSADADCNAAPAAAGDAAHYCFHGKCQLYQCAADADCPKGQKCNQFNGYVCFQPQTGCTWDGQCQDGDTCTNDVCDVTTGNCSHPPALGCCKQDSDCKKSGCSEVACQNATCQYTSKPGCCTAASDCDDGNPCTTDTCNAGSCSAVAKAGCCQADGACDDGDDLSFDKCWKNSCIHTWDGTVASCSAASDCSSNACLQGACSAGKCTYTKSASGACCQSDAGCLKNVSCQVDSCTAGVCVAKAASGPGVHTWFHLDTAALDGWVVVKDKSPAYFHMSTQTAVAGGGALRYGVPGQVSYESSLVGKGSATSPAFAVPKSSASLSFWAYLDVEPGTAVQAAGVDVVLGGTNTTLWSKNKDLGGGVTGPKWVQVVVDLTPWAGQSVQLRAWFDTLVWDSSNKNKLGYILDEFQVSGPCP